MFVDSHFVPHRSCSSNININDVLGDYALTLVDSLDTLAVSRCSCILTPTSLWVVFRSVTITATLLISFQIMGNSSEFKRAVALVVENVSFEKQSTIQVFEATIRWVQHHHLFACFYICMETFFFFFFSESFKKYLVFSSRVLGALLSAHLIITDDKQPFGHMVPEDYDNELLEMAHDLAARLLPAFEKTATGIPYPRVNELREFQNWWRWKCSHVKFKKQSDETLLFSDIFPQTDFYRPCCSLQRARPGRDHPTTLAWQSVLNTIRKNWPCFSR